MTPDLRPDLVRLTAAVDELGAAFLDLAVETLDGESLTTASLLMNRASNMIDGVRAARPPPDRAAASTPRASGRRIKQNMILNWPTCSMIHPESATPRAGATSRARTPMPSVEPPPDSPAPNGPTSTLVTAQPSPARRAPANAARR